MGRGRSREERLIGEERPGWWAAMGEDERGEEGPCQRRCSCQMVGNGGRGGKGKDEGEGGDWEKRCRQGRRGRDGAWRLEGRDGTGTGGAAGWWAAEGGVGKEKRKGRGMGSSTGEKRPRWWAATGGKGRGGKARGGVGTGAAARWWVVAGGVGKVKVKGKWKADKGGEVGMVGGDKRGKEEKGGTAPMLAPVQPPGGED